MRYYTLFDTVIIRFDNIIRPDVTHSTRSIPTPTTETDIPLSEIERRNSEALMRINHSGEISAQALYQAQAITARDPKLSENFKQAAKEEQDHLNWCAARIQTLKGRPSFLNPIWYLGSFVIGLIVGLVGDKVSLGFLAETEHQVVRHLDSHLEMLSSNDLQSRVILEQMRTDELSHATQALNEGGIELPNPIPTLMSCMAKIMTSITKFI